MSIEKMGAKFLKISSSSIRLIICIQLKCAVFEIQVKMVSGRNGRIENEFLEFENFNLISENFKIVTSSQHILANFHMEIRPSHEVHQSLKMYLIENISKKVDS